MSEKPRALGVGNLIIAVYGVFALSATVRALYQLIRKFEEAPLAYSLSLIAGLVYILATYSLATKKFQLANITLYFELLGVLVIGALSVFLPALFAHPTVWSYFGMGYGFIPLVLPIFGIWWLRRMSK
ncbi:MAG: hypothetical protein EBR26_05055 [Microbacteriaceae bacterium]|nr:hypothetical protein [Microbacteriaceae bacterium]